MDSSFLDNDLIELSHRQSGASHWTMRNAVEGVQIFGGIGSGKTSGSGRMLALKYLASGFGGLVLTAKADEKELWQNYCAQTSREKDLIIVEPGQGNHFNFLDYESSQNKGGNSITENILQVLKTVIRASEEKSAGNSDNAFWDDALDMLIFNVIDLCKMAYGRISIQKMFEIVQTLPKADAPEKSQQKEPTGFEVAFDLARKKVLQKVEAWEISQSPEALMKIIADHTYMDAIYNAVPDSRLLKFVDQFFLDTYMTLAEKTRSIIDFSFSGFLHRLLREPVYSLFCNHTSTFTPEDSVKGKIILINLPVKLYYKIGIDSQIMSKYIWQRAMEKRTVEPSTKPVFLWADEAQHFLHERDVDFLATARSSRIATVYLSQNLPNYHASMGGAKSDFKVKSLLGTLSTKIFHANADIETNQYASDLIGDGSFEDTSRTATAANQFSSSKTRSLKIDKIVRPEQFAGLKTGGPGNNYQVEAYMHFQGNILRNGHNHQKIQFNQNYIPHSKTHTV